MAVSTFWRLDHVVRNYDYCVNSGMSSCGCWVLERHSMTLRWRSIKTTDMRIDLTCMVLNLPRMVDVFVCVMLLTPFMYVILVSFPLRTNVVLSTGRTQRS
jgi:hypothetical protein